MFDVDLEALGHRLMEMEEERESNLAAFMADDLTEFDMEARFAELNDILGQLAPLKDLLAGMATPQELAGLGDALDEAKDNLGKMGAEIQKLKVLQEG